MASRCCFWCPKKDYTERKLDDKCSDCGRTYGTPLTAAPVKIGEYQVKEPISRGFYAAAYRAVQPSLGRTVVLKVTPTKVYEVFKKDWSRECAAHAQLAEGTPFLANITEQFTTEIDFEGAPLQCHVAVLQNIEGPSLEDLLKPAGAAAEISARGAAQITLDLYEILQLFNQAQRFHNDLHSGNIIVQRLTEATRRSGAIEPMIRAVAIDFGSVTDDSQSGMDRLGDHHHVARHIAALADIVHRASGQRDEDYRISFALRGLAEHLAPDAEAQRHMTVEDVAKTLQDQMKAIHAPWRSPLSLQRFGDAYNAQALEPWHVPDLWFDPDNQWLARTTTRGPQVITGMRGCGKTMLLRALHFHARVAPTGDKDSGPLALLARDPFVGFYVSCQRLLDPQGQSDDAIRRPFERLYVSYLRDGVQVLRHLRDIDARALTGDIDALLEDALRVLDLGPEDPPKRGEYEFERFLMDLQLRLASGHTRCQLKVSPADAFAHLAAVLQGASSVFAGKYVLFLLDDASTRYLKEGMIRDLISQLLFQHPQCAFRITTEAQALQRVIYSPGKGSPADPNRDYEEFNLGNEVYRLLKEGSLSDRMEFVTKILQKRGEQFPDALYRLSPLEVLGDVPLEEIAREIAESSPTSPKRKHLYRGLRALQAVCVGDIGDVVKIYEKILLRANAANLPASADKQSECFLSHSAHLNYNLNRRNQNHKSLALAFAQASGELLQRSSKAKSRLRQYTKLYVRVDPTKDADAVAGKLLDLLDAGVFVYDGGAPRTKTRDDDSVLQFKLSYRKVLGLASFIGLSDRDRFELSGDALRTWLNEPEKAKDILIANQVTTDEESEETPEGDNGMPAPQASRPLKEPSKKKPGVRAVANGSRQGQLDVSSPQATATVKFLVPSLKIRVQNEPLASWAGEEVDTVVIALGFEERAGESARRLLSTAKPKRVVLVEYGDGQQGRDVIDLIQRLGLPAETVAKASDLEALIHSGERVIIDVSGMSKPFLFLATRTALARSGEVRVVHTLAKEYYPRDEDLETIGIHAGTPIEGDAVAKIESVLLGEQGPYRMNHVQHVEAQPERWRALLASASAKNDRLLHLLDNRLYDATRILVPPPHSPRKTLARFAAEFAASAADSNVGLIDVDTNDVEGAVKALEKAYADLYQDGGANVEIGLTGSKMHAVASAALAAAARVSDVWYVSPAQFDRERFTEGVGETQAFRISVDSPSD